MAGVFRALRLKPWAVDKQVVVVRVVAVIEVVVTDVVVTVVVVVQPTPQHSYNFRARIVSAVREVGRNAPRVTPR